MCENNNHKQPENLVLAAMFPTKKFRKEQEKKEQEQEQKTQAQATADAKKQAFMAAAAANKNKNLADITIGEVLDFFGIKEPEVKIGKIFSIFEKKEEKDEVSLEKIEAFIESGKKAFADFNALLDGLFEQYEQGIIGGMDLVNGFKDIVKRFATECEEIAKIL